MRILVLGGSVFVGRAFATQARQRGHEVTVFNRGRSGPDPAGVKAVRGDRTVAADLSRLVRDRRWDVVVDTSGQQPRVVGESARLLSARAGTYVFVSAVHACADWPAAPVDESSPRHACPPDAAAGTVAHNALKAGCERAVEEEFGGDVLILSPGAVTGPGESTGRLLWWLERFARGGRVLAPGAADRPVRLVDARDLAAFGLDRVEAGDAGRYLVTGPPRPDTLGDLLAACARVAGADREPTWVDDDFLLAAGVEPWTGLPLWVPAGMPDLAGIWQASSDRAHAAGLRCRPLAETVADTMAWLSARGPSPEPYRQGETELGLLPSHEAELLTAWEHLRS
ncbi:NAD-dependent epimerase/dehydratase family protein [Streptantibioticus silvisoli]|uniref:NAD-dependent epimerase/dehydratase family protein n=1 Tax=Streptantibioticus silvisoli TaxID=2705255 RepID=A0ABT6W2B4_9ACTN|nr:NAD-dependent epimerase/dehydratase family protein [Streptantibioticus silvisoli]MDI5964889.1 NAD-dependent epimerase/dehydratase family protein [Streptantibioticus silvisoli]